MPTPFWKISVSETMRVPDPPVGANRIPCAVAGWNWEILQCSTFTTAPAVTLIPLAPPPIVPSMSRPRRMTVIPPVVILTPATPATGTFVQSRVIDFVMVIAPKPPGSRQLMIPPAAVLEIAPANVLQGAVRTHGLTSSPTPDTQVRSAWACAGPGLSIGTHRHPIAVTSNEARMTFLLTLESSHRDRTWPPERPAAREAASWVTIIN